MPKYAAELTQGQSFTRTSDDNGLHDTATRVYKVVLLHPAEVFDPQDYTGTYIGSRHPFNVNLICHSFDAKFDGDSRMVTIVTFNYKNFASWAASAGQQDPKTMTPEIRPANWSTDTSLTEVAANTWTRYSPRGGGVPVKWTVPANPMNDRYDGITKMIPVTTIRIEQYERRDPLINMRYVGYINSEVMKLGLSQFMKHTVMLRGITTKAHVETFRKEVFRGWIATYEFVHRDNFVTYTDIDGSEQVEAIGWDRLQPLEGFYIKNAGLGTPTVDDTALNLEHEDFKVKANFVLQQPFQLASGTQNRKVRAMVSFASPNGGFAQRPSASPIALNADGTPRNVSEQDANGNPVRYPLVARYQTQNALDLPALMNLRIF